MNSKTRLSNVVTLNEILPRAEERGYAVGSFSPRLTPLIQPVLEAAERLCSPIIVQISQKEFNRAGITPSEFAEEFYKQLNSERITVPVVLHLDHTKEFVLVREAVEAGFTSVMIDASDKPLEENIAATREVSRYAHLHGASVEGELGRIGTADFVETDTNVQGLTDPREAERFVDETGVDALAVSVGTAHGLYTTVKPRVDFARLQAIRALTRVHLVLHGGSDVPAAMIRDAIQLPGGGVSKINIATDLEVAMLKALGVKARLTNAECKQLTQSELDIARAAVERTVVDKIVNFLGSRQCGGDLD